MSRFKYISGHWHFYFYYFYFIHLFTFTLLSIYIASRSTGSQNAQKYDTLTTTVNDKQVKIIKFMRAFAEVEIPDAKHKSPRGHYRRIRYQKIVPTSRPALKAAAAIRRFARIDLEDKKPARLQHAALETAQCHGGGRVYLRDLSSLARCFDGLSSTTIRLLLAILLRVSFGPRRRFLARFPDGTVNLRSAEDRPRGETHC